jgi:hypothetical protein
LDIGVKEGVFLKEKPVRAALAVLQTAFLLCAFYPCFLTTDTEFTSVSGMSLWNLWAQAHTVPAAFCSFAGIAAPVAALLLVAFKKSGGIAFLIPAALSILNLALFWEIAAAEYCVQYSVSAGFFILSALQLGSLLLCIASIIRKNLRPSAP